MYYTAIPSSYGLCIIHIHFLYVETYVIWIITFKRTVKQYNTRATRSEYFRAKSNVYKQLNLLVLHFAVLVPSDSFVKRCTKTTPATIRALVVP